MQNKQTSPEAQMVVALGLHLSILIYVVVAFVMSRQLGWVIGWRLEDNNRMLFYALTFMSISVVPVIYILPRLMGVASMGGQTHVSGTYSDSSNPDEKKTSPKTMNLFIIQMALAESIALYGLVLSFLNKSFMIIVPYAFFSLAVQFSVSPLKKKLFSHS